MPIVFKSKFDPFTIIAFIKLEQQIFGWEIIKKRKLIFFSSSWKCVLEKK